MQRKAAIKLPKALCPLRYIYTVIIRCQDYSQNEEGVDIDIDIDRGIGIDE